MRVLIACERSGVVRRAFFERGHEAHSCDLEPCDDDTPDGPAFGGHHWISDARWVVEKCGPWDLVIAHPPCTYLSSSGLHWNARRAGRAQETEKALEFVRFFLSIPTRVCVENPVGCIGTRIRPADQYVQPFEFGDDASKKTGLWLNNLPPLKKNPAAFVNPRTVDGGRNRGMQWRWANQTDSGQNRLGPSPTRAKERSQTYAGIARAMAEQWGNLTEAR